MGEGIHYQTAAGLARHTRAQAHTVMHSVHTSQPPEPPVPTPALQHCQTSPCPVSRGNGVPSSLRPGKAACPLQLLLGPGEVGPSPVAEPATSVGTHSSGMGPGERLDTQPPLPVPWKQNHQHLAKQCLEVLAIFLKDISLLSAMEEYLVIVERENVPESRETWHNDSATCVLAALSPAPATITACQPH